MKLKDFCSKRHMQYQTAIMFIRRRNEKDNFFTNHTSGAGQNMLLDDEAIKVLEEAYPIQPELVPDSEAEYLREIDKYKNIIISLQQENNAQLKTIQEQQQAQFLLTERTAQYEEEKKAKENLIQMQKEISLELGKKEAELEYKESKIEELQKQLEKERTERERLENRSFFQRLFNR